MNGPGTPRYDDTEQAFRDALDDVDSGRDAARRAAALRFVLDHARGRDAMTLWHLISRVEGADRGAVIDALDRAGADAGGDLARRGDAPRSRRARSVVGQAGPRRGELVAKVEDRARYTLTLDVRRSPRFISA